MKKTILFSIFFLFFGLAPHVFAQGFVPLAPIEGLTKGVTADTAGLATFFNNLYKFAIGMASVLAIIMIIWGGLQYATQDIPGAKQEGKDRILQAILGLILVLSPVLVFSIINPNILNLSINLPELKTASGTTTGTGGGTPFTNTTSECIVSGTAGILQIAKCPSADSAGKWSQSCSGNNLHLSAGKQKLESTGITYSEMICSGTQSYLFIDKGAFYQFIVNRVQPLVSATGRPNNGSDAMTFANICRSANIGRQTCVSDTPGVTRSVPCGFSTSLNCYEERLTCENVLTSSGKCSDSPSWTPFQP